MTSRNPPQARRQTQRFGIVHAVTDAQKAALHREIRKRYAAKFDFRSKRINEIEMLIEDSYGDCLPNNEQGREYAIVAMHHLLACDRQQWLDHFAPWMSEFERRRMIAKVIARPLRYRADTLARKFEVSYEQRKRLGITTIGALGFPKAARKRERKQNARARSERHRRAKGARVWAEYVAASHTKLKPWKTEGIDRATWYRRRRKEMRQGTECDKRVRSIGA